MVALQGINLESLLDKAKKLEKKYEWLQAAKFYRKAKSIAFNQKDLIKAANLHEKMGFCFYRAAFQAKDNIDFKKKIKKAIREYQEELRLFEEIEEEDYEPRIKRAKALILYTRSWLDTTIKKRKKLLDEWWTLEKEVLSAYEKNYDDQAVGRTCLDLLEGSLYSRFWVHSDIPDIQKVIIKEGYELAEKAIQKFAKLDEKNELTLGYCFAIWHVGFGSYLLASKNEIKAFHLKALDYLDKAFEILKKNPDERLLSWLYFAACVAVSSCKQDFVSALYYISQSIKYANITQDIFLIQYGKGLQIIMKGHLYRLIEDPDKQRITLEEISKVSQENINRSRIAKAIVFPAYNAYSQAQANLAAIEPDLEIKIGILEKTNNLLLKGVEQLNDWKDATRFFSKALSLNYYLLSKTKQNNEEKLELLKKAQIYGEKTTTQKSHPSAYHVQAESCYQLALIQNELATIEPMVSQQIILLKKATAYLEKSINLTNKDKQVRIGSTWASGIVGLYYVKLGELLQKLYSLTGEKRSFNKAIESYQKAIDSFKSLDLPYHMAEANWYLAQLFDKIGEFQEASKNYESASKAYKLASKKIPPLKDFYLDHSRYMEAWNQIEQARYFHTIEDYGEARQHYEQAAGLHELTSSWNYLAPNYLAWANMEEAEGLSRKESAQKAKIAFQKAYEQFCNAHESFKQKLEKITTDDEEEMTHRMFEASDARRKYCQARILLEEAKVLDREGKYLQSSRKYGEAAQKISTILDKTEFEAEKKELEYITILCQAWERMATAEETTSSEAFLEAADLFEKAKEYCFTKKASLWALGNSSFCRGLAAGIRYQISTNLSDNALAKRHMKSAASSYLQAGYKDASEYAKATLRLFDAYDFINQANSQVNPSTKTKQYQMAENLLQLAASSFMKANQPEKTTKVQEILAGVREEKELAVSLSQVMQAPTITSSTLSFTAPSPTSETSVGLESFEHANVQANLVTTVKQVKIGESFCLSIEFVNAGREPALLMKVDDFVPPDFVVVKKPEIYRLEESTLNMKGKQLAPLKLVEVKLTLQASKKGKYTFDPKVHYLDECGKNKSLQLKALEIKVEEVRLEDRMSTGTEELDSLLLGGFPEEYAVVLSGPPCDEREMIVNNFLNAGIENEGITFHITTEVAGIAGLLDNPNFYLFLCNSKPKTDVPNLPNVYRLQGKADITNLGIALTKAYRSINKSITNKRICVEILSDVLVKHGTNTTREWVSSFITDLGAKGFTMLAVMYPKMHPPDQSEAILALFDGEISITQSDNPLDCKKSILVKKLRNQDYIKNPICVR